MSTSARSDGFDVAQYEFSTVRVPFNSYVRVILTHAVEHRYISRDGCQSFQRVEYARVDWLDLLRGCPRYRPRLGIHSKFSNHSMLLPLKR